MHVVYHTTKENAGDEEVTAEEAVEKQVGSHVRIINRRLILLVVFGYCLSELYLICRSLPQGFLWFSLRKFNEQRWGKSVACL